MAFGRGQPITPTAIGGIEVVLFTPGEGAESPSRATARVQILNSDGSSRVDTYNLVDHLPPATINQLISFMDSVRQKAVTEILPVESIAA